MKRIEEIYTRYSKQIFGYLYHLTGNYDLAGELTQETFYQVIISIPRFKGNSKISTWIYSIARHTYLKKVKKESRYIPTEDHDLNYMIPPDPGANPEVIYQHKENDRHIEQVICQLPEKYASILILRDKQGLSYREISEITGLSDSSVKVTLFRARGRFREIYTQTERGGKQ